MGMLRTAIFILFSLALSIFDIKMLKVPVVILFAQLISLAAFDFLFFKNRMLSNSLGATGCFSVLLMTYFLTKRNIGFGDVGFGLSVGWFLGDWLWIPALFLASLLGIGFILSKRQCIQCKRIPFVPFVAFSSLCVDFFSNTD